MDRRTFLVILVFIIDGEDLIYAYVQFKQYKRKQTLLKVHFKIHYKAIPRNFLDQSIRRRRRQFFISKYHHEIMFLFQLIFEKMKKLKYLFLNIIMKLYFYLTTYFIITYFIKKKKNVRKKSKLCIFQYNHEVNLVIKLHC